MIVKNCCHHCLPLHRILPHRHIDGLGRDFLRGGIRAGARGIAGGAGRGAGSSFGFAGLRAAISTLSRTAATAIRATYRAIRFRGTLNFTTTTAVHMGEVGRRVPHHILKLAI